MAGHSHWANIANKKALIDNKRGKLWSKLSKAVTVAARMGGGDPDANPRLRLAVADAKAGRMPKDTIERAIKKGTGELEGGNMEETVYEGYAPGGVAVMLDILTDNRNRTAPEIRKVFEMAGGSLGSTGCVAWMFERKGLFLISASSIDEEKLTEFALENGADDVKLAGDKYELTCDPASFMATSDALDSAGIAVEMKKLTNLPKSTVDLDAETARKVLGLMEALDDHDDVQNVSANFNIPEETLAEIGG
jgi:YebC/PmpR family DNA-binding regulatory protein